MVSFTPMKLLLDPAFSYLVFGKEQNRRGDHDFKEVFEKLDQLNIEFMSQETFQDKASDHVCLAVKLKEKHLNASKMELLAAVLPKDITYSFYGATTED